MVFEKMGFTVDESAILKESVRENKFSFEWRDSGFIICNAEGEPILDASLLFRDGVITLSIDRERYDGVIFKKIDHYVNSWPNDANYQLVQ